MKVEDLAAMFRQTSPCGDCPFRRVGGVRHGRERMRAYASYFGFPGASFPCHQTRPADCDNSTWEAWRNGQTICAGGLLFAQKYHEQNVLVMIAVACGAFDPATLIGHELVFDTLEEMLEAE